MRGRGDDRGGWEGRDDHPDQDGDETKPSAGERLPLSAGDLAFLSREVGDRGVLRPRRVTRRAPAPGSALVRPISRPYLDVLDLPQELSEASRDARHGLCFVCLLPRSRAADCLILRRVCPRCCLVGPRFPKTFRNGKVDFLVFARREGEERATKGEGLIDVSD